MPFFNKNKPVKPKLIAVASGKGGVGKSTISNNLSLELSAQGYRVGLLDADIYGPSQPSMLGQEHAQCSITESGKIIPATAHGIHFVSISALLDNSGPVIWRAPIATRVIIDFLTKIDWPELDYLILDLPPGTGDIQITLAQKAEIFGALIVTTPQHVAANIAQKAISLFNKVNVPILGLVENMSHFVCQHCEHENHVFPHSGSQHLADLHKTEILARIPLHSDLGQLADSGQAITSLSAQHPVRQSYKKLLDKFFQAIKKQEQAEAKTNTLLSADKKAITVTFPDHSTKIITAYSLRHACPCAECIDEFTGEQRLNFENIPHDISIKKIETVGSYGIKPIFSDKHTTGIFTYQRLRKLENVPPNKPMPKTDTSNIKEATVESVQAVLDQHLNPQIAQHDGRISIKKIEGNTVYVEMAGGCQGCSQSEVTLKSGVKTLVKKYFPELTQIVDATEHAKGMNPYYQ